MAAVGVLGTLEMLVEIPCQQSRVPIIGDRRKPSPLGDIQPDHWLPEYTTELLNVLNVLAMLVELEPHQAELLDRIWPVTPEASDN
jgi:hypothetical protein